MVLWAASTGWTACFGMFVLDVFVHGLLRYEPVSGALAARVLKCVMVRMLLFEILSNFRSGRFWLKRCGRSFGCEFRIVGLLFPLG